ncbi:unnamed protein product [Arabidopsis halleri]
MESRSMAVIASNLDSLVDLLSGFIVWFTANEMRKPNRFLRQNRPKPVTLSIRKTPDATFDMRTFLSPRPWQLSAKLLPMEFWVVKRQWASIRIHAACFPLYS